MEGRNLARGSLSNPEGRFETTVGERVENDLEWEEPVLLRTEFFREKSKKIVTKNDSPDVPFDFSINPYRGCEHGCIYCYARLNHGYINLSPGLDFESKIFYKDGAAELLEREFRKKTYRPKTIVIGSATDPYQPGERKFQITRKLLQVFLRFQHPVGLITKSSLILRDLDILQELASMNLVRINVSVTTLQPDLHRKMEPRTSSPGNRIHTIRELRKAKVPTGALMAPLIPFLNDWELESVAREVKSAGVDSFGYIMLRLPFEVKDLFSEWLSHHYPLKKQHILNLIRSTRGGKDYDSEFGKRMRGQGNYADLVGKRFSIITKKLGLNQSRITLTTSRFRRPGEGLQGFLSFADLNARSEIL